MFFAQFLHFFAERQNQNGHFLQTNLQTVSCFLHDGKKISGIHAAIFLRHEFCADFCSYYEERRDGEGRGGERTGGERRGWELRGP